MHRAIVIAALLSGVLVGATCTLLTVRSGTPAALADGDPHAGSGFCMDANGDGLVNIADATFTLGYLFLGEPASVDCSTPPHEAPHLLEQIAALEAEVASLQAELARRGSLPATGQTKCYDGNLPANEVDCASAEYPGQDGFYQAGCPNEGRFIDHGDGTVTDICTGLMWQKNRADYNGNGKVDQNTTDSPTWTAALLYCDGLSFAGHDDWRLPNVRELQSIVDCSRYDPAIAPVFIALSSTYWSSSTYLGYNASENAWSVSFDDGILGGASKWGVHYIRAVRDAR